MMALSVSDKTFATAQITNLLVMFHAHAKNQGDHWTAERAEGIWKELKQQLDECHDQVREYARSLGLTVPDKQ